MLSRKFPMSTFVVPSKRTIENESPGFAPAVGSALPVVTQVDEPDTAALDQILPPTDPGGTV